jgi:hypothetical protein
MSCDHGPTKAKSLDLLLEVMTKDAYLAAIKAAYEQGERAGRETILTGALPAVENAGFDYECAERYAFIKGYLMMLATRPYLNEGARRLLVGEWYGGGDNGLDP